MKTMTYDEFLAAMKLQANSRVEVVVKCPMCKTLQMGRDFMALGLSEDEAMRALGSSCIGRKMRAPSPRKVPDGQPCDWTLGGLFRMHTLEVVTPDGQTHPHFELATEQEAQQHRERAAQQGVAS